MFARRDELVAAYETCPPGAPQRLRLDFLDALAARSLNGLGAWSAWMLRPRSRGRQCGQPGL